MPQHRPIIGIPADRRMIGPHPFHAVGEKYIDAIARAADAIPLLIPVLEPQLDIGELLARVDGIFFTGSPSNVEPRHYAGPPSDPGTWHDPHRDATTLPLIPAAVASGVPILGVCRGFQEMNVAFGGTLYQKVHEQSGFLDHREDPAQTLDAQYAPAHEVIIESASALHAMAGEARPRVNSLHSQGVERLGNDLVVDARAPDGLIEAFHVKSAPQFAMAVQWHPEWRVLTNTFSRELFAAFGRAARERAESR